MDYLKQFIPDTLPTYSLQYVMGGYDRRGKQCRVNIYIRSSFVSPLITLVGAGGNPIVVQTSFADQDFFRPIVGSQCKLSIQTTSYQQLYVWAKADETMYMVEVIEDYEGDTEQMIFVGFLNPSTYSQHYDIQNAVVTITAVDALALLKNFDFDPPGNGPGYTDDETGPVWGAHELQYVLAYILSKIGNRYPFANFIPLEWAFNATVPSVDYRLFSTPIIIAEYYNWNCHDVLVHILNKFRAQVLMQPVKSTDYNSIYMFRSMDEPLVYTNAGGVLYSRQGDYLTDYGIAAEYFPVHIMTAQTHFERLGGTLKSSKSVRSLTVERKSEPITNMIFNGDFKHGKAGWFTEVADNYSKFIVHTGWMGMETSDKWTGLAATRRIATYFGRYIEGHVGWISGVRVRVKFDARRTASGFNIPENWSLDIGMETPEGVFTEHSFWIENNKNEWVSLSHEFTIIHPTYFYINALHSAYGSYLSIRNVEIRLTKNRGTDEYQPFDEDSSKTTHVLHPESFHKVSDDISKYQLNAYVYHNVFARNAPAFGGYNKWYVRYHNKPGEESLTDNIERRLKRYYEYIRTIINCEFYIRKKSKYTNNDVVLTGVSLVQDTELEATFLITSMTRNLIPNTVSMELTEYVDYLLTEPPEPEPRPWILADGEWNDKGVWKDTENWKDE